MRFFTRALFRCSCLASLSFIAAAGSLATLGFIAAAGVLVALGLAAAGGPAAFTVSLVLRVTIGSVAICAVRTVASATSGISPAAAPAPE